MPTSDLTNCPGCGASWQGDPIPETSRKNFGGATHFKRQVAIYSREEDMTIAWMCPDCKRTFDRFTMKERISWPRSGGSQEGPGG
jgi:hypothetical protein